MCFKFFRASSSGLLRLHGPQSRRCSGSHHAVNQQPSQSSPSSTVQQPATCSSSARVDLSPPLPPDSTSSVVVPGPSSVFSLTSPSRVPTIRRLPKASRCLAADKFSALLEGVVSHNDVSSWVSLLSFATNGPYTANVLINAHSQSGGRWRIFLKKRAAGHLGSASSKYCHRNNPLPFETFFVSLLLCVLFFRLLYCFFGIL